MPLVNVILTVFHSCIDCIHLTYLRGKEKLIERGRYFFSLDQIASGYGAARVMVNGLYLTLPVFCDG